MLEAPPGHGQGHVLDPVARRIGTIGALSGGALLTVLVVLRSGVGEYGNVRRLLRVAAVLPDPAPDYRALSLPGPLLARLLGIETEAPWVLVHAAILVLVAAWVIWKVSRWALPAGRHRDAAILLACSQVPAVLLLALGHYDVFTIGGGSLVAIGGGAGSLVAGALLMGLSNAEHAGGALVALAFVGYVTRAAVVRRALWALGIVVAARVALGIWSAGTTQSRGDLFFGNLGDSVRGVARNGWIHVFTWYGAAWIFVILAIARAPARRLWLLAGLVVLPAALTLITLDGTRVFAVASWPAYVEFVRATLAEPRSGDDDPVTAPDAVRQMSTLVLVIAFVTPAVVTWSRGAILTPWQDLLDLVP